MALNKLKKWVGTQAMTAFFDQLNDNVDATNAAIDLAEHNAAGNFGSGVVVTDDPMSIADSMTSGVTFFMSQTDNIEGQYGWGIIVRRFNMRFITAFTLAHKVYMKQRVSDVHSWTEWRVPSS